MNHIVIDIETAPDRAGEYARLWPKSKKKQGIHAIISQVVCIGLSVNGEKPEAIDRIDYESEKALLLSLSEKLNALKPTIIGYNSKGFDLPILQLRAAKAGIKLDLPDKRSPRCIDLYEHLGGKWQTDTSACSLSELAWFLYGTPKTSGGEEVAAWWAKKDLQSIREHCLADVELTNRIYKDYRGVLW
jgi:DNA polymerase elongation subunit (family B)